jgi:hypothetical protein
MWSRALVVLAAAAALARPSRGDVACRLTQGVPSKPEPSLTQCYKFNAMSCCRPGHDAVILARYAELFSTNCLRQYPLLEHWFCLGCNPDGYKFIDSRGPQPTVRVCKQYASDLWQLDLDKCGILLGVSNPLRNASNPAAAWSVGEVQVSSSKELVLPTMVFSNAEEFIKHLLPPFFEPYAVQVVEDINGNCLTNAARRAFGAMSSLLVLITLREFA